ncbi:TolC family protein [Terrimonas rubra]|uniref:TolC family protein n=1 Tax=Terrimonas rubra TaxID=1035890 RepID=A0ABW6AAL3_9BACT
MFNKKIYVPLLFAGICFILVSCKIPAVTQREENKTVPQSFSNNRDTANTATIQWRQFFTDPLLINLIDTALKNNQELLITLQEIEISRNEIGIRQGKLLPAVNYRAAMGVEKVGRYTSQGAGDAGTDIKPGKAMPEPLGDFNLSAVASWEVDIWKKLRNAKKAAITKYLSTIEGKNFVITNLVAEIASSYYELLALDNQLAIVKQNIALQNNALEIVKVQKEASKATELAVKKFEAEVYSSQSLEFNILQQITETENRINLLLGRFPQPVTRSTAAFATSLLPQSINSGIPAQLLTNRPDIKQAELELAAAKLDVKVARAEFYPSLDLSASFGVQAFNPAYITRLPESLLYSLAGDLVGPLINRRAIKVEFYNANARQLQAMYEYERSIVTACVEVSSTLSNIQNLQKSYALKSKEVEALTQSIAISGDLFKSARADYLEVLMTQRDALDAKLELVDTIKEQLIATVNIYKSLGGGWQ